MKKQLLSASLLLACVSSTSMAAGPVANIKVAGDIKPPTCSVNGGDNDIIFDYGTISPSMIPQSTNYSLDPRTANIEVVCDAQTYLTFVASDVYTSNNASSWEKGTFGLVNKENTEQEVGGLLIRAINIKVDGETAFWGRTGDVTWSSSYIVKNATTGWTTESQNQIEANQLKLVSGKIFSAELRAGSDESNPNYGYILSKSKLASEGVDITDGVDYIGQAILSFNFGI